MRRTDCADAQGPWPVARVSTEAAMIRIMLEPPVLDCDGCPLGAAAGCPLRPQTFEQGTLLLRQGEVPPRIHLIKRGTVSLSAVASNGAEASFRLRGPRTLVGLEALQGQAAREEVRALDRVHTCAAPVSALTAWIGGPRTPARMMLGLALQGFEASGDDRALWQGDATVRVARLLSAWSRSDARPRLGHHLMARALDMRPETFSRCLLRLEERGLIRRGQPLEVLDADGLRALGEAA